MTLHRCRGERPHARAAVAMARPMRGRPEQILRSTPVPPPAPRPPSCRGARRTRGGREFIEYCAAQRVQLRRAEIVNRPTPPSTPRRITAPSARS